MPNNGIRRRLSTRDAVVGSKPKNMFIFPCIRMSTAPSPVGHAGGQPQKPQSAPRGRGLSPSLRPSSMTLNLRTSEYGFHAPLLACRLNSLSNWVSLIQSAFAIFPSLNNK